MQRLIPLFEHNKWDEVGAVLLDALHRLERSGAEFAAILANTPHNAYEQIRSASPLEILTIMDATSEALVRDGRSRVALLGTRPTMEFGFFQKQFQVRGIETLVPGPRERKELDRIVWEELSHGTVRPESRQAAKSVIGDLVSEGAEAVILGCTELCLLIQPADSSLPLYDTTRIHAEAILEFAMK